MVSDKQFECQKCGVCCRKYPCAVDPNDLSAIARFFKLEIDVLIEKYFIWDWDTSGDPSVYRYYLCPKRKGDIKSWATLGWAFSNTPCIFLTDKNLCAIHPVKPRGGREGSCEDPGFSKWDAWKVWQDHSILKRWLKQRKEVDSPENVSLSDILEGTMGLLDHLSDGLFSKERLDDK